MDWKVIGKQLANIGLPLLGGAVGGPAGAIVGKGIAAALGLGQDATPEQAAVALGSLSGEQLVALKTLEAQMAGDQLEHDTKDRQADSADLAAVNTTMQAEAANSAHESWWQTGWRPFNGYVVGLASLLAVCLVCFLFYRALTIKDAASIAQVLSFIPQLAMSIAAILAIPGAAVGITAYHRGVLQREQVKIQGK